MHQTAARAQRRISGLDGLRGLAVALVVVFHAWPRALPGGFLGVTLFFSLSGYLITSILIDELGRTGGVALGRFWSRRCRRLLPASLSTLLAVAVVWGAAGWLTDGVRRDLTASVLQVANWSQVAAHHPYGAAGDTSPLLHFWSLAIEEQFYWLFPLIAVACGTVRRFGAVLVGLLTASVAATVWSAGDAVVVYYSTATRAAEMLAGAVVAVALSRRQLAGWAAHVAGVVGIVGVGGIVALTRLTSLDTSAYYAGGLAVVGAGAAVTIGAIAQAPGLARALDTRPLSWLGAHSYGIYLFHWPLLVGLRDAGVPASPVVAVATTLLLAAASARWVEAPFRNAVPLRDRISIGRTALVAVPVVAVLVAGAVLAPVDAEPTTAIDFDRATELAVTAMTAPPVRSVTYERTVTGPTTPVSAAPTTTPASAPGTTAPVPAAPTAQARLAPGAPVTFGFVGDSKALTLGIGAMQHLDARLTQVPLFAKLGCPIGRGGRSRVAARDGRGSDTGEACDWSVALPPALAATGPVDVAVVYAGTWDARERQVPFLGDRWSTIDDADYRTWLLGEMATLSQLLIDGGVGRVAWMTVMPDPADPHRDRILAFDTLVRQFAAAHPDTVTVIDLAAWLATQPDAGALLPDGEHTTFEPDGGTSVAVMERFLTEQILRAAA